MREGRSTSRRVAGLADTGSVFPTFGIVKPAVPNTRVDCSPCGQSVFADAVDAIQSVGPPSMPLSTRSTQARYASSSPTSCSTKGRLRRRARADSLWTGRLHRLPQGDEHRGHDPRVRFGAQDRLTGSGSAIGPPSAGRPLRVRHQLLHFDNSGYVKTATEVSSDNSASCATCASTRTRCRRDRQHEPGTSGLFPCARRRHSGRRLRAGAV